VEDIDLKTPILITDTESLGRGLQLMVAVQNELGEAVQTLALVIGGAGAAHPDLKETLLRFTKNEATGGGRKMLDVIAAVLNHQPPPPFGGTRLRIVGGTERPEAKAA